MHLMRTAKLCASLSFVLAASCNGPTGREVPGEIPGWIRAGSVPGDYVMGIDHSVVHGGAGSGYVQAKSASPGGFGTLMQTVVPDGFKGKRVRLGATVRTEGVTSWAGMWMRVDGAGDKTLAFDNMASRPLRGTMDWARQEVVLDVSAEATAVAFGLLLQGGGTVWLDDVSLEVVDRSVPVTESPAPAPLWFGAGSAPADYEMGDAPAPERSGATSTSFLRSRASAKDTGFGTWMRYAPARPFRGKRVRLRGGVEATGVTGWAGLWMRVDGAGSPAPKLGFDNMEDRPIKGSLPWTPYEVVLDVPADAEGIYYGTLLQGAGALRMADLELQAVDESVPVTRAAPARAPSAAPSTTLRPLPPPGYQLAGSAPEAFETTGDPGATRGAGAVLRSKVADPGGFGTLMQTVDAAPFRGKRARLTGQVKADDVRGWAGLWARVDGADGKPTAFDNMEGRPLRGTLGWARYDVVLEVPLTATRVAFGALLSGAGRIEVGELTLSAADGAVEPTDLVHPRRAPLTAPRNLGFDE